MTLLALVAIIFFGFATYNLTCAFLDIPTKRTSRMMLLARKQQGVKAEKLLDVYITKIAGLIAPYLKLDKLKRNKLQRALDLRQYLARGRKRRTRKKGRKAKGPRIPMRVPIADRPEAVGSRKGFGHFESDTVVGAAPSRRCMNTQVERRSRRLFARLVDDKSASATARAEYEIFKDIPPAARVDRTWDNGTEASLHMLVDEALGMLTYFADPYSSWQRGSNENRNGRIRRYLPKGTGFEDLAQEDLDAIVGEINDTPMKLLGYKTPNEVWDEEIAKLQSKAASPNTSVALTN